jgi:hypothetical protein
MDYLHQTMDSDKLVDVLDLPNTLRGRKVEVIVLPAQETYALQIKRESAFGCLRKYANPLLIAEEHSAWEQAVIEKYADR